jgi:hypothetical protein
MSHSLAKALSSAKPITRMKRLSFRNVPMLISATDVAAMACSSSALKIAVGPASDLMAAAYRAARH